MNTASIMGGSFSKGSFSGTTAFVVKMKFAPIPATVWVRPTAGAVTVSYSVDEGVNYTAVTTLNAVTAYADAVLSGPVTYLQFTGDAAAAGTWGVC